MIILIRQLRRRRILIRFEPSFRFLFFNLGRLFGILSSLS